MSEPHLFGYIIILFILILLSAFFSAAETAFISFGRHHFQKIVEMDEKKAKRLRFWFENPNRILVTTLIGNNIVNISASVIAATLTYSYLHRISATLVTGVMTFIILVFAEIIPKSLAKKHSEKIAYYFTFPVMFFCVLLTPIARFLIGISHLFVRLFGERIENIIPVLTEEDIKAMIIAGEQEGIIEEEERDMIDSIFELGDKMVREIMTPRVNIVSVKEETPVEDVIKVMAREGYSRLPVYRESIDKITGIIYIKDIIGHRIENTEQPEILQAKDIMREPYFVPESKKVNDLMRELQEKKMQMAIVVDEYGGTAGLVTMEDLVEEIVGEIADEYKKEPKELYLLPDGDFLVSGSMEIEKVNEETGVDIPEGQFETIAGFVLDRFGKFPVKGESFVYNNYQFTVQESDRKKVRMIKIKKLRERENE
ncbi:MAG: hemolysin family protein [Candidatus Omnitrophica bacterium]|nr:hemolysin family protein [Candidatus Omnitrophota bacterium]MCM8777667.1 hemolysin family protein [Candidatus Omnitrophota bacterium]